MNNLYNTDIECHACNGAGHTLIIQGNSCLERKCGACDGTGLSSIGKAMNGLDSVFTCAKCGAHKVHYRLHSYQCPNRCRDEQ